MSSQLRSKRTADQENRLVIDENPRVPKRLKASPVDDPLAILLDPVFEALDEVPPSLVTKGIKFALRNIKSSRASPENYILRAIDTQINTLTEAGPLEGYDILFEGMITSLNKIKDSLKADDEVMPVPSAFAQPSGWVPAQEGPDAILCLRPRNKQGLPLITLHEAFLYFVNESKKPLPPT